MAIQHATHDLLTRAALTQSQDLASLFSRNDPWITNTIQSRSTRGETTHAGSPTTRLPYIRATCARLTVSAPTALHIRLFASNSQNDGHAGEVTRNIIVHIRAIDDQGTDNCDLDSGMCLLEISYQQLHGKLVFDIG